MFSHDPLTEETRELLDKVMSGGNVGGHHYWNQEVQLALIWHYSPPVWSLCRTRIPSCIDLELGHFKDEVGLRSFCRESEVVVTQVSHFRPRHRFHWGGGYIKGVLPGMPVNISCDFLDIHQREPTIHRQDET